MKMQGWFGNGKKSIPIPIPALNIMVNHEISPNSGLESGDPSLIFLRGEIRMAIFIKRKSARLHIEDWSEAIYHS